MNTDEKKIEEWLDDVRRGVVCLPRFQRDEVWKPPLVEKFLWAILKDRPLGVFLVLKVDTDNPPFETKKLEGGPETRGHLINIFLRGL